VYQALTHYPAVKKVSGKEDKMLDDLKKGRITGIISITPAPSGEVRKYRVDMSTSSAGADKIQYLQNIVSNVIHRIDSGIFKNNQSIASVHTTEVPGRAYRQIDFILPGMLGFSLLSAGIFGTAFVFFSLRQTLVLKRFFATPISRLNIVLGETLARLIFQIITAVIIIGLGYFAFGFTLQRGWETFFEMLALSAFGLVIFMGFGFIISSIARSESTIPPLANIITLPQFLLAGTFFPIDVFPGWLQPVCRFLPLTYLNDAFRKVAFEGAGLTEVPRELIILAVWGIVVYIVATKVFRWE
jgi:ABC-2 type transport system permease protein